MISLVNRSPKLRVTVIAVALLTLLAAMVTLGTPAGTQPENNTTFDQKGMIAGLDAISPNRTTDVPALTRAEVFAKEHPMSDQYALKEIAELFGAEAASHAKHRLTKTYLADWAATISPINQSSRNWSGYKLYNSNIKGLIGQFPARHTTGSNALDYSWVGVGGDTTLIQTGIDQGTMQGFWEEVPDMYIQYISGFNVSAGDDIHAGVHYDPNTGYWAVALFDQTNQDYFFTEYHCSPNSIADWIVETPYSNPQHTAQYNIGSFSSVNFTNAQWWDASLTYHPINYSGTLYKKNMTTLNNETMNPSSLGYDGKSFSISHS